VAGAPGFATAIAFAAVASGMLESRPARTSLTAFSDQLERVPASVD